MIKSTMDPDFIKKLLPYLGLSTLTVIGIIFFTCKKLPISLLLIIGLSIIALMSSVISAFFAYWLSFRFELISYLQNKLEGLIWFVIFLSMLCAANGLFHIFPKTR